ncbi:MAG: hypothetical protein O7F12_07265 [Nitrospirae bacterium]|nr:hypothetical protein [Nitrospirota bacterium]
MHSPHSEPNSETPPLSPEETLQQAFQLFELSPSFTTDQLQNRQQELLRTWQPERYAGHTNNPRKYMQMYKKGEVMTRQVKSAYQALLKWREQNQNSSESEIT